MNWFRFYHDALDDPKVQRLDPALFKSWVNLLCLASKADERGCLPSIEDIGFALRVSDDEAAQIIDELSRRGLIDGDECEREIHNWHGRQRRSDDVTARVQKHRKGETGEDESDETLHETNTKRSGNGLEKNRVDTDTDTEQSREEKEPPPAAPSRSEPQPFDVLLALCEATGADVAELSKDVKSKQLGKAKQLLAKGKSVEDIGRCAAYLSSESWRTSGIDLFTVDKDWGKWELAGKPATANSRASPNGQHLSPQQRKHQRILEIANGEPI